MIETVVSIIFILTALTSIFYAFRGAYNTGEKGLEHRGGAIAVILPVKDPPDLDPLIENLDRQGLKFTLYIVYQGGKPRIRYRPSNISVEILEGGETPWYRGKIGNIVHLFKERDLSNYEYIVFIDDDVIPHPEWLRELLGLADRFCISTGYRLYLPKPLRLRNILISIWNLYSLETLYGKDRIVWGGSACFQRRLFNIDILKRLWRGAVSDDVAYTHIARCNGLTIGFNEKVLVIGRPFRSLRETLGFILRQQRIVYMYSRDLWRKGLLIHLYINMVTALMFYKLYRYMFLGFGNMLDLLVILSILGIYIGYILKNHFRLGRISKIFGRGYAGTFRLFRLLNIIFMPIVINLQSILLLLSMGDTIYWRGKTYRLPAPKDLGYDNCTDSIIEEHGCEEE